MRRPILKRKLPVFLGLIATLVLILAAFLYTPDRTRAYLDARYLVAATDLVDVAGLRLHLRDSGPRAAPALVFLHGFGSSLQTWDAWADQLSAHYRVLRYDLPGFALTGPDPTGDYSEARGIAILMALLDERGIARATLVGNSIGGALAWRFAAAYPDRVDRLVLISPDGFASPGFAYDTPAAVPWALGLLRYCLPRWVVRMSLAPAYADAARLSDATVTRYWDLMRAPGVRQAMLARLEQTRLSDPLPVLAKIAAPTLLLWGEQDGMIPVANAADYQRALPHATLVVLPGLGHVPMEEDPTAALVPLSAFLDATARPEG